MGNKNVLINGDFNIWQRGTSFISGTNNTEDNKYYADRWVLLSGNGTADVNDVVSIVRDTDGPNGSLYALKATVTANGATTNSKYGFLQIIEQANCKHLIGSTASLSFQAKTTGNAIRNIRVAIISWTGTADTFVAATERDVVSDWKGEGVNPKLVDNWTYESVPTDLPLTIGYQTFKIENISIGLGAKNVAVFIWIDDTDADSGDELFIGQVQLEKGAVATEFEHRSIGEELTLCQRYYYRTDNDGTPTSEGGWWFLAINPTQAYGGGNCPTTMRDTPSITLYDSGGTINTVQVLAGSSTAATATQINARGFDMITTTASWATGSQITATVVADAEL